MRVTGILILLMDYKMGIKKKTPRGMSSGAFSLV